MNRRGRPSTWGKEIQKDVGKKSERKNNADKASKKKLQVSLPLPLK